MQYNIKEENGFRYLEEGEGEVMVILHGLFGAMSNFTHVINHYRERIKVSVPILPIYELPLLDATVGGLVKRVHKFIEWKGYTKVHLLGNSLGGHLGLLYCLKHLDKVKTLTLTGSSGLYESAMGDSYPRKSNYEYIKEKTEYTFYDPKTATKELIDEVFDAVNDRSKAIRILSMAKSAMRNNLREELNQINIPVLLIWGKQDTITPPFVGEEFQKLLPNAELHFIDKSGHAPMMEQPVEFNKLLDEFLMKQKVYA